MNSELTHGGGVVIRRESDKILYLVVTARRNPNHWVLPKGHIDPGESPEESATREVMEETGVQAQILDFIGAIRFTKQRKEVHAGFYLMEFISQSEPEEQRNTRWFTYQEARRRITFDGYAKMLDGAYQIIGDL